MKEAYDLRTLTAELAESFPEIEALYLFGSRRYRTGSMRSDVDILVEVRGGSHIRPQELRAFSTAHCRALDLFVAEGGKAVSCANESHVRAASFKELVKRLEAVCFWNRSNGTLPADVDWKFEVPIGIDFKQTAMLTVEPIAGGWLPAFRVTSPSFCTTVSERVYITTSSGKDAKGGSQGAVGDRRAALCGAITAGAGGL